MYNERGEGAAGARRTEPVPCLKRLPTGAARCSLQQSASPFNMPLKLPDKVAYNLGPRLDTAATLGNKIANIGP